jgi:HSP20 family protein
MEGTRVQRRSESLPMSAEGALRQLRTPLVEWLNAPFGRFMPAFTFGGDLPSFPVAEVTDDEVEYTVTAEVPGLKKENITVSYDNGVLTIAGEKKEDVKEENKKYHIFERSYGSFERTFTFPTPANADKITASVAEGILTVHLPKVAVTKPVAKKIEIR